MPELLHAGALVPAGIGACCTVGAARHGRGAGALLAAVVMIMAMLDVVTGTRVLPATAWAAVLIGAALVVVLAARLRGQDARSRSARRLWPTPGAGSQGTGALPLAGHRRRMVAHSALGLIAMAGLLAAMEMPTVAGVQAASATHHGGGLAAGTGIAVAVAALTIGYLVFSAVSVMGVWRESTRGGASAATGWRNALPVLEIAAMGSSTLLMAVALL